MADDFSNFFYTKIDKIRTELEEYPLFVPPSLHIPEFSHFVEVSEDTLRGLIQKAKPATCGLDPMPSFLVKHYTETLAPAICKIVNTSLTSGVFAAEWKQAVVKPLLKKPSLEHIMKNYRPVSNLSFISKLVEKASLISFLQHVEKHQLLPDYQSAYRPKYSTETLLLKIYNDILLNMEHQRLTPLVAIDLSAAFDTVNHNLLLDILEKCYGVSGTVRAWIESYLSGRSFNVLVNEAKSSPININFSVPQGSINGPIYFTCYASTLKGAIGDACHLAGYADDHDLYTSFRAGDEFSEKVAFQELSSSVDSAKSWMLSNRLKMNDGKTEFIVFGSSRLLHKRKILNIQVGDAVVNGSPSVRLLGVDMDEELTFKQHIAKKARVAGLAMHNLRKLRPFLSKSNCLKIANALIFSHMDYANSLLINLPVSTLKPFQRIQNMTAKLILNRSKFSSTTEALRELHILPVHVRAEFKLLVIVYKCVNGLAPSYLSDLLEAQAPKKATRSATQQLLRVPFTKHKTFADRSFSVAGPKLWNQIPPNVRNSETLDQFKKTLKTFLFSRTFMES